MQTPDLDDVKESVRQGVTKVAGRLSNLASGAMSQLQVKSIFFFFTKMRERSERSEFF